MILVRFSEGIAGATPATVDPQTLKIPKGAQSFTQETRVSRDN